MNISVILDLVVIVMLAATIIAGFALNRRFVAFRAAREEFEQVVERFNQAAARAEAGVTTLRQTSDDTGRQLQQSIDKAKALRDELNFLVERGEPIVDRLIAANRAAPRAPEAAETSAQLAPRPAKPAAEAKPAAAPESDLLKTLSSLR